MTQLHSIFDLEGMERCQEMEERFVDFELMRREALVSCPCQKIVRGIQSLFSSR